MTRAKLLEIRAETLAHHAEAFRHLASMELPRRLAEWRKSRERPSGRLLDEQMSALIIEDRQHPFLTWLRGFKSLREFATRAVSVRYEQDFSRDLGASEETPHGFALRLIGQAARLGVADGPNTDEVELVRSSTEDVRRLLEPLNSGELLLTAADLSSIDRHLQKSLPRAPDSELPSLDGVEWAAVVDFAHTLARTLAHRLKERSRHVALESVEAKADAIIEAGRTIIEGVEPGGSRAPFQGL